MYSVGFNTARDAELVTLLDIVKEALDGGRAVILHCRAGVHRAELTFCICWMYLKGTSLAEARATLESVRRVKLDESILPTWRQNGSSTEYHRSYFGAWEAKTMRDDYFRVLPPMPLVRLAPRTRPQEPTEEVEQVEERRMPQVTPRGSAEGAAQAAVALKKEFYPHGTTAASSSSGPAVVKKERPKVVPWAKENKEKRGE